jgi:hypothetical protein
MYVQCMYNAMEQQLTDMVYTIIEKHKHDFNMYVYIHFCKCYTRM